MGKTYRDKQHLLVEDEPEGPLAELAEGLIVDGSRGMYRVETELGPLTCTIRGKLRKELIYGESRATSRSVRKVNVKPHDPVAVGDRVRVLPTGHGVA